jgi:hypothetical protein
MIDNIEAKLSGENRIVRHALSSVYNKIAKLITNALFTLGINSCAYIIHQFPKNIRESVYELIKKQVQQYDDSSDLEIKDRSDLEIMGGFGESGHEQRDIIISIVKVELDKINKDQWKEVTTYFGSNNNWDFSVKFLRIGLAILLASFLQKNNIINHTFFAHVAAHGTLDLSLWIGKGLFFWNSNINPSSQAVNNSLSVHELSREERKQKKREERYEQKFKDKKLIKDKIKEKFKSSKSKNSSKTGGSITFKRFKKKTPRSLYS